MVSVLGVGIWYYLAHPKIAPSVQAQVLKPHVYKDPTQGISKIDLKIFYVVPSNLSADPNWHDQIQSVLKEVSDFHAVQFHNSSLLKAQIYPSPVILPHDDAYYDTQDTSNGNPQGLRSIEPGLERDYPDFLKVPQGEFLSVAIIYEGVGASGGEGGMILSRTFLAKDEYKLSRASLFYHEFAHTFGLPDRFDQENNPDSDGVMGNGRYKPISINYIETDFLEGLGLVNP